MPFDLPRDFRRFDAGCVHAGVWALQGGSLAVPVAQLLRGANLPHGTIRITIEARVPRVLYGPEYTISSNLAFFNC